MSEFDKKHPSRIKNKQSKDLIEKVFDEHIPTLYYAPPLSFVEKKLGISR
jgi:hypothetical protein